MLAGSAAYSLQIVLMERYAPRYDAVAFTFVEMLAAFAGFAVVAVALGQIELPRGWTVWGALLVTGVFASALGFLVQTWAQQRTSATRTALAFALEPVWAGIFGFWLAGDRLGAVAWVGAVLIMAGIVVAEPAAARTLRRLVAVAEHPAAPPGARPESGIAAAPALVASLASAELAANGARRAQGRVVVDVVPREVAADRGGTCFAPISIEAAWTVKGPTTFVRSRRRVTSRALSVATGSGSGVVVSGVARARRHRVDR